MSTENAVPEVRNLKQMLQYQEKAVVSRMLIKNPVGNVTLFAFDGNEGLSEHTAPYDALVIGVEGRAEIPVGGVKHTLGEGDSLLLPANIPHAVNPVGGFKMLLIMIRG
ncbi:cupin domain-containing protein [Dechloromonas sp. CZR5]|uniref:cupin domain-containing protein n=1 Tax=Dechloromonas sp. CZR5 TaxID=2608630 RepID=UPI00123E0593|nr:cupin domain-containing protein [Dechloromonas sp. CZR5]